MNVREPLDGADPAAHRDAPTGPFPPVTREETSMHPFPHACVRSPGLPDASRPSIARVYDYSLGGKDNYSADRAAYDKVLAIAPHHHRASLMNRRWLHRVVRYLAGPVGIDQFLDIGAGLPTTANTHESVQLENPQATVVYVDNDPVCAAHGLALLERNPRTHFVGGDFLAPGTLLENPAVRRNLVPDRPIGLLVCGLLHHLDDRADLAATMQEYVSRLPVGSYVAISHFWDPGPEHPRRHELATRLQSAFLDGLGSGWHRSRGEIEKYFAGLELVHPGVVEVDDWWPSGPQLDERPPEALILGGVGRKTGLTLAR